MATAAAKDDMLGRWSNRLRRREDKTVCGAHGPVVVHSGRADSAAAVLEAAL
jgi:hypothetical protein